MGTMLRRGVLLLLFVSGAVWARGGGSAGNGGGVLVSNNGALVTYGSEMIPVKPFLSPTQIPGLKIALDGINQLEIDSVLKNEFLGAMTPTLLRRYFTMDLTNVSQALLKRLLARYGEVNARLRPGEHPVTEIVAITAKTDTYLLPDFFKIATQQGQLDPVGQAALLFHEALWVINPNFDVLNVVEMEIAFEKYLRHENDVRIYYELARNFSASDDLAVVNAYIQHDIKRGNLGSLVGSSGGKPTILTRALFGDSLELKEDAQNFDMGCLSAQLDNGKWGEQLLNLENQYPDSLFLQFLSLNSANLGVASFSDSLPGAALQSGDFILGLAPRSSLELEFRNTSCESRSMPTQAADFGVSCNYLTSGGRGFVSQPIQASPGCSGHIVLVLPQLWGDDSSDQAVTNGFGIEQADHFLLDEEQVDLAIERK